MKPVLASVTDSRVQSTSDTDSDTHSDNDLQSGEHVHVDSGTNVDTLDTTRGEIIRKDVDDTGITGYGSVLKRRHTLLTDKRSDAVNNDDIDTDISTPAMDARSGGYNRIYFELGVDDLISSRDANNTPL